jgi:protease-4
MNSIPPILPEEQVRQAYDEVARSCRRRRWLWFFFICSLLLNCIFYGIFSFTSKHRKKTEPGSIFEERYLSGERESDNKIAVIRLDGVISYNSEGRVGYDGMVGDIREQLRTAVKDKGVKAIILKIDSPGGEVLAADEIYRAVVEANKEKPVICSMGSLAASGGYYAAMGSRWVIADELTLTGSIGVIMETLNYQDLMGKVGLKFLVFKSGKFKDLLNGAREPTQEEKDLVQNLVMETYDQFVGIVAKARKIDVEELKNNIADGRIFSGKQALAARLVDQNGSFEVAIDKAKSIAGIQDALVIDYVVPFSLGDLFGAFAKATPPKIQLEIDPQQIHLQQGKLYYLSFHMF